MLRCANSALSPMTDSNSTLGVVWYSCRHDGLTWNVNDPAIGNLNPSGDLLVVLRFDDYSAEEGLCLNGSSLPRAFVSGYDKLLIRTTLNNDSNAKRRASILVWNVSHPR